MSTNVTPKYIADHIRRVLKDGGSAPHSEDVQRFFKEEIQSRGWYTAELRRFAVRFRRAITRERGMEFLVPGALSAGAPDCRQARPLPPGLPLGEVAESLAATRGVCGADPGSARASVLCRDRAALESIAA